MNQNREELLFQPGQTLGRYKLLDLFTQVCRAIQFRSNNDTGSSTPHGCCTVNETVNKR